MRPHIKASIDEAEALGRVDVSLQGIEIRHHIRITEVIAFGEHPAKAISRLFGHVRSDLGNRIVVVRVQIPAGDAQRIFQQVDERGAMGIDVWFARGPCDELGDADRILAVNSGRAIFLSSGSSESGRTAEIISTFFSASIARMAGNGASMTV